MITVDNLVIELTRHFPELTPALLEEEREYGEANAFLVYAVMSVFFGEVVEGSRRSGDQELARRGAAMLEQLVASPDQSIEEGLYVRVVSHLTSPDRSVWVEQFAGPRLLEQLVAMKEFDDGEGQA